MKKPKKRKSKNSSKRRVKSTKSSKRLAAESKARKQTSTKRPMKSSLANASKLKRVAKDAAVAAGVAALDTALTAMEPRRKGGEKAAGSGAEKKDDA